MSSSSGKVVGYSADLRLLERRIGVRFKDQSLLNQAFLHRSYLHEHPADPTSSNERMEFLGDAFIGYVVAYELFKEFPNLSEGELTKLRAALVQRDTLFQVASELGLGDYLLLGRGEESSGGRKRPANLARVYEAVVGAILLDQGAETAQDFVIQSLGPQLAAIREGELFADYKSLLQQLAQSRRLGVPLYRVIDEIGPDHAKEFTVEVSVGDSVLGTGTGGSKQIAEKRAAQVAVEALSHSTV